MKFEWHPGIIDAHRRVYEREVAVTKLIALGVSEPNARDLVRTVECIAHLTADSPLDAWGDPVRMTANRKTPSRPVTCAELREKPNEGWP